MEILLLVLLAHSRDALIVQEEQPVNIQDVKTRLFILKSALQVPFPQSQILLEDGGLLPLGEIRELSTMSVRYSDGAEESKLGDSAKAEVQQAIARQAQSRIENKRWNFIVNQTFIYIPKICGHNIIGNTSELKKYKVMHKRQSRRILSTIESQHDNKYLSMKSIDKIKIYRYS